MLSFTAMIRTFATKVGAALFLNEHTVSHLIVNIQYYNTQNTYINIYKATAVMLC